MSAQPLIEDDDRRDAIRQDLMAATYATCRLESIMRRLRGCVDPTDAEVMTAASIMLEAGEEAVGVCMSILIDSLSPMLDIDPREDKFEETEAAFAVHQRQYRRMMNSE